MNIYNSGNSTVVTSSENPHLPSQLDIHLDELSKCRNVTELCTALLDVKANFLRWSQEEQKLYIEKAFSLARKFNPEESLVTMQMMTFLTGKMITYTPETEHYDRSIYDDITPFELRNLRLATYHGTQCEKCIELVKEEFFTANLDRQLQLIDALMFYANRNETQILKVVEQLIDKVNGNNWEELVQEAGRHFPPLTEHGTDIRPIFQCLKAVRSTTHNPLESYLSQFNYVTATVPREKLRPEERMHIASQVLSVLWEGGQDLQLVKEWKAPAYANVWPELEQLAEEFMKCKPLPLRDNVEICGQKFKNKRIHPNTAEYWAIKDNIDQNVTIKWSPKEAFVLQYDWLCDRPGYLFSDADITRKLDAKEFAFACYAARMKQTGFKGSFKEYIEFMKTDGFQLQDYTDAKWNDIDNVLKFT